MVQSRAATVDDYLAELPEEQRAEVTAVRDVIVAHVPDGYVEGMMWGMITWHVPLEVSGPTYNKQPLSYVALAAQKRYFSVYLTTVNGEGEESFRTRYEATGKKLDMGKSCVRFKRSEDLALDVIGAQVASMPVAEFLDWHRAASAR
ncbi:iron chaperone [Lentzea sp. NPDC059081]|uniref:iron chaperone n=1 Tax=Lentzea sp. NPDC059081 TaxID=3346719 RepID=UPI0036C55F9B